MIFLSLFDCHLELLILSSVHFLSNDIRLDLSRAWNRILIKFNVKGFRFVLVSPFVTHNEERKFRERIYS